MTRGEKRQFPKGAKGPGSGFKGPGSKGLGFKGPHGSKPGRGQKAPGGKSTSGKPAGAKPRGGKPFPSPQKAPPQRSHPQHSGGRPQHRPDGGSSLWLYGLHAVRAALANPERRIHRAVLTARAAEEIGADLLAHVRVEPADMDAVTRLLPPGAVHQGAAISCDPLRGQTIDAVLSEPSEGKKKIILVLDQISDPHNVGAILRTALAFGVSAVIVQDRHAPPQSGALAKAASGALDLIPYIEVVNISRALEELAGRGFWRIALAGDGDMSLAEAVPPGDVALVVGAEGSGVRRLVREHCEASAFVPIDAAMESLNVSNAAAIALYEIRRS